MTTRPWTNKRAIMQDLSVVQGHVPGARYKVVTAGSKPPALIVQEETEEEYFYKFTGEGDFNNTPDLKLIKHMLDLVRDQDVSPTSEKDEPIIQISKLEPNNEKNILEPASLQIKKAEETKVKVKRNRNAALESILAFPANQMIGISSSDEPVKLLRPADFVLPKNEVVKENKKGTLKKPGLIGSCMFRRKNVRISPKIEDSEKTIEKRKLQPKLPVAFVPTSAAKEYYNKYLERSKVMKMTQDTIWNKLEGQMKEIDNRRLKEIEEFKASQESAVQSDIDETTSFGVEDSFESIISSTSGVSGATSREKSSLSDQTLDKVRLPQHRHLLTGPCIVCEVMSKWQTMNPKEVSDSSERESPCSNLVD